MPDAASILTFIIAAFALAGVLILKRDTVPPALRRGMALIAIVMVVSAFILMMIYFLRGTA